MSQQYPPPPYDGRPQSHRQYSQQPVYLQQGPPYMVQTPVSPPGRLSTSIKVMLGISAFALLLAVALIAFALVSSGKLGGLAQTVPDGYLSSNQDGLVWVTWTEKDGSLTGQWNSDTVQDGKANYLTYPVTGTHNNNQIALTIQAGIVNIPAAGTLANTILTLQASFGGQAKSVTLHGASISDYNAALKLFQLHHPS